MIVAWVTLLVLGFIAPIGIAFGYVRWTSRPRPGKHRERTYTFERDGVSYLTPRSGWTA